ncbi:hypothetical protein B0I37DRAFT_436374 [Chaetomium sp. MPI-CAGE-AT-0009]|nr:hypothetical protein B0I37DRAFT_436374 [Chaetomium sp. MPI-CAGE-AT-0009]
MPHPTTLFTAALPLLLLAGPAAARTDYEGCVSTKLPAAQSTIWYVPGTGELCEPLDCGGGRAPPKTVPGCPAYKGTETVTPRFFSGLDEGVVPTPVPTGAGGGGADGGDGDGGRGWVVVVVMPGATASRTGTKTSSGAGDVEETGAAGGGKGEDEDGDEDGEGSKSSPTPSAGGQGGKGSMATMTKVMTAVETVDGVVRPAPTGSGEGDATVSTAAAVPSAVVAKGMFGVVAGIAAAGLVFA